MPELNEVNEVTTEVTTEITPEPVVVATPKAKKKSTAPSTRTLKKNIKELKEELDAKDLELQMMTDKALIFQEQANELKSIVSDIKRGNDNAMATVRGALVNAVNILDVLGGK